MRRPMVKGCLGLSLIALVVAIGAVALAFLQGRRTPPGAPVYVALGSSYAAGAGLGELQLGSPLLCARSIGGYPPRLARMLRLPLVDMSCGGAVSAHLLRGGQAFQGAQIRVIDARTQLVTITAGGNDIGLVGDLSSMALRRQPTLLGRITRQMWGGPKVTRDYAGLRRNLVAILQTIHARAPRARIVLASYPAILPPEGTCASLQLTEGEVAAMRQVEAALAATTRDAAREGGAAFVDMHRLGAPHHACSAKPWVHGWSALLDAPFHPTAAGAEATAHAIAAALRLPAGVAAVGEHDASRHQAGRVGGEKQHG